MEIMLTAHEGNDAVILKQASLKQMTEMEFYQFAVKLMPVPWLWDDDMQLVYYIDGTDNYLLLNGE